MKLKMFTVLALVAMFVVAQPLAALAGETKPVQLSLFAPAQIYDGDVSIKGLRLNLIYTVNDDVTGIDWGLIANHTTGDEKAWMMGLANIVEGDSTGVQWGLFGQTKGDFYGWQSNLVSITGGHFTGLQGGLYCQSDSLRGFQWGLINRVMGDSTGLQLALVNMAGQLRDGLQIGLLNFNQDGNPFGFFPLVNWSF